VRTAGRFQWLYPCAALTAIVLLSAALIAASGPVSGAALAYAQGPVRAGDPAPRSHLPHPDPGAGRPAAHLRRDGPAAGPVRRLLGHATPRADAIVAVDSDGLHLSVLPGRTTKCG